MLNRQPYFIYAWKFLERAEMRAIAFAFFLLSPCLLYADDSATEAAARIAELLKEDAPIATVRAGKELLSLDEAGQLDVSVALLAKASQALTDASSALSPLELPVLTWPDLSADSDRPPDVPNAEAAALLYEKTGAPLSPFSPEVANLMLQIILDCADRHLAAADRSPDWVAVANDARRLRQELSETENSLAVRSEVLPMIAKANVALLRAAALPEDDSVRLVGDKRSRLISSAKTAVARCLPYMKWAPSRVQTDYRNAIHSLIALESGSSSRAINLLIALSHGLASPDGEHLTVVAETARPAASLSPLDGENKRLILLNRLTRDPSNIRLLREFAEVLQEGAESLDRDALDAIQTVMANAVYRVDELYIPEILARLEELEIISRSLQQVEDDTGIDESEPEVIGGLIDDAAAGLQSLQENLEVFLEARGDLSDGIERLSSLLDNPFATEDQRARGNSLLSNYVEAEQARNTLHYLAASTARLEVLKTSSWPAANLDEAVSVLNASEQLLASLWGLSKNATSGAVKIRCEELPKLLAEYRTQILYAKSRDGLAAIADMAKQAENLAVIELGAQVNDSLKKLERVVRSAEGEFLRLASTQAQDEAQPTLQKMQSYLQELRREQVNRYQHHVIVKCKQVLNKFDDQWYCTEGEAIKYFEKYNLAEVDHSLLTPEVSRCLNDCIGKLFSKMSPNSLVKCEAAMGRPAGKLKLESF